MVAAGYDNLTAAKTCCLIGPPVHGKPLTEQTENRHKVTQGCQAL